MSYKKKKLKKGFVNQLKRRIGLIKIALLKKYKLFIQKNQISMQQRQTINIMRSLRQRSRTIRENNLRINEWIDTYIDSCVLNGKPVEILTQYCLSKDLEKRFKLQGNQFLPLTTEVDLFAKQIPTVIEIFKSNNVSVNWSITFNDSYIERGRVDENVSSKYIGMIEELVKNKEILLLNWEKDILEGKPKPSKKILSNFFDFISMDAYKIAMSDLLRRTEKLPDFAEIKSGFDEGLRFKIACEAEEGRVLAEGVVPMFEQNGQFILIPLEFPERYVFFSALAPGFQKRIVSVLKPYPWRISGDISEFD